MSFERLRSKLGFVSTDTIDGSTPKVESNNIEKPVKKTEPEPAAAPVNTKQSNPVEVKEEDPFIESKFGGDSIEFHEEESDSKSTEASESSQEAAVKDEVQNKDETSADEGDDSDAGSGDVLFF